MTFTIKKMHTIEVQAHPNNEEIYIIDPVDNGYDDEHIIAIHVDQVDIVVKWLQEAKQAILDAQANQESS